MLERTRLTCWVLPQGKPLNVCVSSYAMYPPPNTCIQHTRTVTNLQMRLEQIGVPQREQGVK